MDDHNSSNFNHHHHHHLQQQLVGDSRSYTTNTWNNNHNINPIQLNSSNLNDINYLVSSSSLNTPMLDHQQSLHLDLHWANSTTKDADENNSFNFTNTTKDHHHYLSSNDEIHLAKIKKELSLVVDSSTKQLIDETLIYNNFLNQDEFMNLASRSYTTQDEEIQDFQDHLYNGSYFEALAPSKPSSFSSTKDGGSNFDNKQSSSHNNNVGRFEGSISFDLHDHQYDNNNNNNTSKVIPKMTKRSSNNSYGGSSSGLATEKTLPNKKPRMESTQSSLPPTKEELRERISTLQGLVDPFGKTDRASVLMGAIEYIKALQEQIQMLSVPYLKSSLGNNIKMQGNSSARENKDLRSRGLCLVPTSHITNANVDEVTWSTPHFN